MAVCSFLYPDLFTSTDLLSCSDQLHLTPLRYRIVPPPMSSVQISTLQSNPTNPSNPRVINHLAFGSCFPGFATLRSNGQVTCYHWDPSLDSQNKPKPVLPAPTEMTTFTFDHSPSLTVTYRQISISTTPSTDGSPSIVIFALFTELEPTSSLLQDGIHIQRLTWSSQVESSGVIHAAQRVSDPVILRAPSSERWWKLSTSHTSDSVSIQTSVGTMFKGQ